MKVYLVIMVLFGMGFAIVRYAATPEVRRHFGPGLAIAFGLVTFTGLVTANPFVYFSSCFVAVFIGVRSRLDAACRFMLMSALTPYVFRHVSAFGAYLLDLGPMHMYQLALAAFCLVRPRKGAALDRRPTSEDAAITIFTLIFMFAVVRNYTILGLPRQILGPFLQFALPYMLFTRIVRDRKDVRVILGVLIGVATILGVFAIYEARFGWSLFDNIWRNFGEGSFMSRNMRIRSGFLRTPTTFLESTSYAVFAMTCLIVALYARRLFRTTGRWMACCGVIALSLVACQSRGSLLGFAAGMFVALIFSRSFGKAIALAAAAGSLVFGLLTLAQTSARASSFVGADAAYVGQDYRQQLLWTGIEQGIKHFWIGEDLATVESQMSSLIQGEHIIDLVNSYLNIFLVGGIIGLLGFLVPILLTFVKLWQRRDLRRDADGRMFQACLAGAIAGILTALIFTSLQERNPFWLIMMLASAKIVLRPARVAKPAGEIPEERAGKSRRPSRVAQAFA